MSLTKASLDNPYGVIALSLVVVALGIFAFFRTPTDLFPDSAPPQVAVIIVESGASADDIADKITQVVEKEINTITGVKRIRSTSRDEVASIVPEFYYTKSIGDAVSDVQSVIARIRAKLPKDIREPMLYKITDATRPLLTIAISAKTNSPKDLTTVRLLAENELKDAFLRVPGVGDVDTFGANEPEVQILVDRDKLNAFGITIEQVLAQVQKQNVAAPAGTVYTQKGEYLVRVQGQFGSLDQIRDLPITRTSAGRVLLKNVAEVKLTQHEPRSGYIGNSRKAVAINIMRPDGGKTVWAIKNVKKELKKLKKRYPDILFEITNDQQPIIDVNVQGMRSSVYQSVFLTVLVILIFLADARAAFAISLSIPIAFLAALVVLWFSPYTLNMVTLSGVIIAIGMVVDASIVVLENIYRRHKEQPDTPVRDVVLSASNEIFHGVLAGALTTVVVLIPVIFTGGYTQQIMRPLNMMITATILASLVAAFTIVPLVASKILGKPVPRFLSFVNNFLKPFTRWMDRRTEDVVRISAILLRHKKKTIFFALFFFIFTMKVVKPLNGQELMPPMDTGIGIIKFDTPTYYSPEQVMKVAETVGKMVRKTTEGLKWISTVNGSEPGQISFGSGGATAQSVVMTITMVNRKKRKLTIWDMEKRWRAGLRKIDGVRTFSVTEYGATPLSTTKAPLDLVISGPDIHILNRLADEVIAKLHGVKGLTDVRRSWYIDKEEQNIIVDPDLARFYGLTPQDIANTTKIAVKGVATSQMRLHGALDIPILVKYRHEHINELHKLEDIILPTKKRNIPLRTVAKISTVKNPPFTTHENLLNTIDVTGINTDLTIKQVGMQAMAQLKSLTLPNGYSINVSGTLENMKTGGKEMGGALMIGIVMLYILLVWMFKSFLHPFTIMTSILIAVAAAMWGLLLFDKPMCKPAMMGMILLAGTVVNNAILLLDFIIKARKKGVPKDEAIIQSVRVRFRPIVMTAVSTALGLTPLVFEMAVGMERMSPLGVVAAVGLLVGIFGSVWIYPCVYSLFDSMAEKLN